MSTTSSKKLDPPGTSATTDNTTTNTNSRSDAISRMEEEKKAKEAEAKRAKEAGNTNFYRKVNVESIARRDKARQNINDIDIASITSTYDKPLGATASYTKDNFGGGRKMRKSRKSRKMRKGKKSRKMRKTRR